MDDAASVAVRDLGNRTRGLEHELRSRLAHGPVEDEVLCERVRARLGSVASHPGAVEVAALPGRVTFSGAVREREYVRLLRGRCGRCAVWTRSGIAWRRTRKVTGSRPFRAGGGRPHAGRVS